MATDGPSPSASGIDLLIDVATKYYVHHLSQTEIARQLGLAPATVSRYLKRASEEGVVRVEIGAPRRLDTDLGRQLAERYRLSRVVVAGTGSDIDAYAAVAAAYVSALLKSGMSIGVDWGETLAAVVRHMEPGTVSGLRIAQLAGGFSDSAPGIQGHELVRHLAGLYPDSKVFYLHAPSIVDSPATRQALMIESSVQLALAAAKRTDLALVGIGHMDDDATMLREGHIGPNDRASLLHAGAVGSMNSRFFDTSGRPVATLDKRTIGLEWSNLAAVPLVVALAIGAHKVEAIRGALRTGCVKVLVTDVEVAGRLMRLAS